MAKGKVKGAWINSPQAEAVAEYYVQGHSVTETAKRFGVPKYQVNNLAKLRRFTNGRNFRTARAEDMKREAERQLAEHVAGMGFRYIGGYSDKNGKATVECCECGARFDRTVDFIKRRGVSCPECRKAEARKRRAEARKLEDERREREKQRAEAEKAEALFHSLNDRIHVCTVCGCNFSIADFMKSKKRKLIPTAPKYCSVECERKHHNQLIKAAKKRSGTLDRGNHRHRARKYGVAYEPGITLKKVFKRDNGICQICGEPCDWSDRGWNKYCGPTYPSIDHIIALVNGGGHVWGNVQLAHLMCNSEKGAAIEEEVLHDAG